MLEVSQTDLAWKLNRDRLMISCDRWDLVKTAALGAGIIHALKRNQSSRFVNEYMLFPEHPKLQPCMFAFGLGQVGEASCLCTCI